MGGKKLCVCVPTFERHKAVKKILDAEAEMLYGNSVDIIFFDSGKNGLCGDTVREYIKKYPNIRYIGMDPAMHSSKKMMLIYKGMAKRNYEYVWLIHDHTVFCEAALRYILKALESGGDMYYLKTQSSAYGSRRITDINEVFEDAAWLFNSMGTVILRRDTFLEGTRWKNIADKYLTAEALNYAHIGYYLERLSELKAPEIFRLDFKRESFYDFMRYEKPSWSGSAVRICLECWGTVITSLPDVYINKEAVLRTQDKWFMSKYRLLEYKKDGCYDLGMFLKYRKWIRLIMPENYADAFRIAVLPYLLADRYYCGELLDKIAQQRRLGRKICLYGAGRHAFECFSFLRSRGVGIDGYLVSSREGNPSEIKGVRVFQADDFLRGNKAFVIIAVLTSGAAEVRKYLGFLKENNSGAVFEYADFE